MFLPLLLCIGLLSPRRFVEVKVCELVTLGSLDPRRFVVLGSSQSFCGLCSKLVVRDPDSALKDSDKERWTELLCEVHRRIG